jgi:hypothetical protein
MLRLLLAGGTFVAYLYAMSLLTRGLGTLPRNSPLSFPIFLFNSAVFILGAVFWIVPDAFQRTSKQGYWLDPNLAARADSRIVCRGSRRMLSRLCRHGSLSDAAFEPKVFRMFLPLFEQSVDAVVSFVAGVAALIVMGTLSHTFAPRPFPFYIPLVLPAAGMGVLATSLLIPTYLRVVPGRADILRYRFLGRAVAAVAKIDLRTGRVEFDLRDGSLYAGNGRVGIPVSAIHSTKAAGHAVLLAAASSHTAPPLPDDELVG